MKDKVKDVAEVIADTVDDLVADFVYYDRKEDRALPDGAINRAIAEGAISVEDIVRRFEATLRASL